ncbi:MAG: hypothetical protein U0790_22375 [Isosphaeraceae bacterium]
MTGGSGSQFRLAIVATSLANLREKLDTAVRKFENGVPRQIRDVSGIYFASRPLARAGELALLFPGEGSQYRDMLADLCPHFPEVRECFDQIDGVYHGHPRGYVRHHIFPRAQIREGKAGSHEQNLWEIAGAVEAVLTANQAILTVLKGLGLRPDVIVGHSTGDSPRCVRPASSILSGINSPTSSSSSTATTRTRRGRACPVPSSLRWERAGSVLVNRPRSRRRDLRGDG